eukprot:3267871-Rhodomonas_salina.1
MCIARRWRSVSSATLRRWLRLCAESPCWCDGMSKPPRIPPPPCAGGLWCRGARASRRSSSRRGPAAVGAR